MVIVKQSSIDTARELARQFHETAVARDLQGGNPKKERDLIRESGLLKLLIPERFGGLGGTWLDVLEVVGIFAKVDSSLAHVYGYHFVNLITPHLCGDEQQQEFYYRETAANNLFWGNAFNPVDIKLRVYKEEDSFYVDGVKTFCSGSVDSDYLIISALYEKEEEPLIAVIPTKRDGITVNEDWDHFGQRQTDSGTVHFSHVKLHEHEILRNGFYKNEFSRLRVNISNFILNHLYLGLIEGAFDEAKHYAASKTRVRSSYYKSATDDPIIQKHFGEFFVDIEAAKLLVEKSDRLFQKAWDSGNALTERELQELYTLASTAKVFLTKVGLDITSRVFEVMGSRATSNVYRFDRYWRNLRTMTLHVPVDTVIQELGQKVFEE